MAGSENLPEAGQFIDILPVARSVYVWHVGLAVCHSEKREAARTLDPVPRSPLGYIGVIQKIIVYCSL